MNNTVIIVVATLIALWILTRKQSPMVSGPKGGVPAPSAGMLMRGEGGYPGYPTGCPEGMIC